MALKWGFACAGKVAHDYLNAIGTLEEGHHEVVAIAEPMFVQQAENLAQKFNIPKCYTTFLELAQDPNVEVVHVGTLNPQHLEVSLLMLQHGKHVLCQKPLCMNEKQARQLIEYARQKKLFLTEAIWSRCFPSYQYIRSEIKSGKLGQIKLVEIDFSTPEMLNIDRFSKKALGGGTTLDIGVYAIQFCQFVYEQEPISIQATGVLNDDEVDVEVIAELKYSNNGVAKIKTSFLERFSNEAKIVGTNGTMRVPNFWCPTKVIDVDGSEKNWPLPKAKYEFHYPTNMCGLRYEADVVRKCIRAGKLERDWMSHNESLIIARIEDEIRKQVGVKFPADD